MFKRSLAGYKQLGFIWAIVCMKRVNPLAIKPAQEEESGLDLEGYTKAVELTVNQAEREFYSLLNNVGPSQVATAKSLMWLSLVLFGSYITTIKYISVTLIGDGEYFSLLVCSWVLHVIAFLACIAGFSCAVISIPAFGNFDNLCKGTGNWKKYQDASYGHLGQVGSGVYLDHLTRQLVDFESACDKANKVVSSRGRKLRFSCYFTVASTFWWVASMLIASFVYYL